MDRELSSYAFSTYGHDAKLYNGIHDLETAAAIARCEAEIAAAEAALRSGDANVDGLTLCLADWRDELRLLVGER